MSAPAKTGTSNLQELRRLVCDSHDLVRIVKVAQSFPGGIVVLQKVTRLSDELDALYERWAKAEGRDQ